MELRRRTHAAVVMRGARRGAALLLVAVGSCRLSPPLTKRDAAALVRESAAFVRPRYVRIPREITVTGPVSSAYSGTLSLFDVARVDPGVAILQLHRDLEVRETLYGTGATATHQLALLPAASLVDAALEGDTATEGALAAQTRLEEAETEIAQREAVPYGRVRRVRGWRAPIAARQFVDVEQIHNYRDPNIQLLVNQLAVDFTWTWRPTDLGEAFDAESATFQAMPDSVQDQAKRQRVRLYTAAPLHSRAFLQRQGDTWVVDHIDWSYGRGNPS